MKRARVRTKDFRNTLTRDGIGRTRTAREGHFRLTVDADALPSGFAMTIVSEAHVPLAGPVRVVERTAPEGEVRIDDTELGSGVVGRDPDRVPRYLDDGELDDGELDESASHVRRRAEGMPYRSILAQMMEQAARSRFEPTCWYAEIGDDSAVRRALVLFDGLASGFIAPTPSQGDFRTAFSRQALVTKFPIEGGQRVRGSEPRRRR